MAVTLAGREKDAASQDGLLEERKAEHQCEELKEGVRLEPLKAVLRRKTQEAWTDKP